MKKTDIDIILMLGGEKLSTDKQMEYLVIKDKFRFLRIPSDLKPEMVLEGSYVYPDSDLFSDWNGVMKVVDFIENIDSGIYQVDIKQEGCQILKRCKLQEDFDFTVGYLEPETSKFDATYMAVAKFADYYNKGAI